MSLVVDRDAAAPRRLVCEVKEALVLRRVEPVAPGVAIDVCRL
jgi:hypothetical protein